MLEGEGRVVCATKGMCHLMTCSSVTFSVEAPRAHATSRATVVFDRGIGSGTPCFWFTAPMGAAQAVQLSSTRP